jgi:putative addiction module CopG family antidote
MPIQRLSQTEARIQEKIDSGAYDSPDQVIEADLRLLDEEERRLVWLQAELAIGARCSN